MSAPFFLLRMLFVLVTFWLVFSFYSYTMELEPNKMANLIEERSAAITAGSPTVAEVDNHSHQPLMANDRDADAFLQRQTRLFRTETEVLASLIGRQTLIDEPARPSITPVDRYMDLNLWLEMDAHVQPIENSAKVEVFRANTTLLGATTDDLDQKQRLNTDHHDQALVTDMTFKSMESSNLVRNHLLEIRNELDAPNSYSSSNVTCDLLELLDS